MRTRVAFGSFLAVLATLLAGSFSLSAARAADVPDHPIVPGFERFYTATTDAEGGMLLLGELNCTSCHQAEASAAALVAPKQAPLLGEVGARANPKFLREFLANPHAVKPGTTMPTLLSDQSPAERAAQLEPLVHYLVSLSSEKFTLSGPDASAVGRGKELFHQVGCVACHAPQEGDAKTVAELGATSAPLGKLETKYSIQSLRAFLLDPLHVRPSGRMPNLVLSSDEATDLAHYLLRDADYPATVQVAYYEGAWQNVPDFDKLQPTSTGGSVSLSLNKAPRNDNFAYRLDSFLEITQEGDYTFHTTSDDGSVLWIDGQKVVDNDGIHGLVTKSGKVHLKPGRHPLRVGFVQGGGGYELIVELEGPGLSRQTVPTSMLKSSADPQPQEAPFIVRPELVDQGRALFVTVGCASCHALGGDQAKLASQLTAPKLAQLDPAKGCLTAAPSKSHPHYPLSAAQRASLAAAVTSLKQAAPPTLTKAEATHATLVRLNCLACHKRDELGGAEALRNSYFTASDKDLGDEGRLPPLLTGVGDKLKPQWLAAVIETAAQARPYMHTRMPQFGKENVAGLAAAFAELDKVSPVMPAVHDSPDAAKDAGRALVGTQGLSCISCHSFGGIKSLGIQAMDLTVMPQRLNEDWFYRYMLNPQQFRPGTRMPQAWPNGQSFKPDILAGSPERQIAALYDYLSDGRKAIRPEGLIVTGTELIVGGEALIYRNFIEGAGSRAIAVGYPEQVNLAFDAEQLRIALLWQGKFMDASRHWNGRGQGFEPPAGEKVVALTPGAPFAKLVDAEASWPSEVGHAAGYQFQGYELDKLRQPTFRYRFGEIQITDKPQANEEPNRRWLDRTLKLTASSAPAGIYFRAAAAGKIEAVNETTFRINDLFTLELQSAAKPILRNSGQAELLVPIEWKDGQAEIIEQFRW